MYQSAAETNSWRMLQFTFDMLYSLLLNLKYILQTAWRQ